MTVFCLVRHGQTLWNLEGRYQGHLDAPLTEAGLAQARALLPMLAGPGWDALCSSDLGRAVTTAGLLARGLGLELRLHAGLREMSQGRWEGLQVAEIQNRFAHEWQGRITDPLNAHAPGGESLAEVADRVWAAADDIARVHPGGRVIVVSHGLSLATILCRVHGLPLAHAFNLIPDNCTPVLVEWKAPH